MVWIKYTFWVSIIFFTSIKSYSADSKQRRTSYNDHSHLQQQLDLFKSEIRHLQDTVADLKGNYVQAMLMVCTVLNHDVLLRCLQKKTKKT